jgi:hypothetical protein
MDIRDFIEKIEPQQATTTSASAEEDLHLMSITSIAISLKRIADMLSESSIQVGPDRRIFEATIRRQN